MILATCDCGETFVSNGLDQAPVVARMYHEHWAVGHNVKAPDRMRWQIIATTARGMPREAWEVKVPAPVRVNVVRKDGYT